MAHLLTAGRCALAILLLSTAACTVIKTDTSNTTQATRDFDAMVDRGDYDGIYDRFVRPFGNSVAEDQFRQRLKTGLEKVGPCQPGTVSMSFYNASSAGKTLVTRSYRRCTNGDLDQQFTWKLTDKGESLYQYNASMPLVTLGR